MPANEDTSLEVATQIRDMLRSQNELYMAQARLIRGQLAMMESMAEAMGSIDTDRLRDGFESATEHLDAAEEAMRNFSTSGQAGMGRVAAGAATTADAIDSLGDSFLQAGDRLQTLGTGGIIFEALKKGINTSIDALGGFGGILAEIFDGVKSLATVILGSLLSPFEVLFKQAAQPVTNTAFREAVENLRGAFGDLATNEGAAVMEMFKSLGRQLGDTGLATRRILGPPADQLRFMTELAKGLGDRFNMVFNQGLIENAGNIVGFKKALDLSDESMKTTARIASTTGRTMDEVLREQANYAIQLGDAFGISFTEISRGMQEMENDMKRFGGMSKKALAESAVYAKRLGIEVKTLAGIMDAFDNFDSAADAAARLNQQFGIQIDTLEMLREEDPARRADMLRDSLRAAGVSYTDLDRRSKSYLASQLQISEAEAELLFNQKNQGLSLDEIKKKSGEAEKKQLTQVEVMDRLADAIQRIVRQMQQMEEGIFANFFKGFNEGIANSREMRQLLRQVSEIMLIALQSGRQLGRAFVDLFPGITQIIEGFQELFDVSRWRKSFKDIVETFKTFFVAIQTDPAAGLRNLWTRLQEIFFGHFDASGAGGSKLLNGFKTFFATIIRVIAGAIRVVIPEILHGIRDAMKYLTNILSGRGEGGSGNVADAVGEDLSSNLGAAFGDLFDSIAETFDDFWVRYGEDIWNAFTGLVGVIFDRVRPWLEEHWTEILLGLGAFFAGPAIVGALASGLGAAFSSALGDLFAGGIGGLMGGGAAAGAAGGGGLMDGLGSMLGITGEATGAVNEATEAAGGAGGFEQLLTNVATILTANGAIQSLMESLFDFAQRIQANNISTGSVAIAVGMLAAVGAILYGFVKLAGSIDSFGGGVAAAGLITGLVAFFSQISGGDGGGVINQLMDYIDPFIERFIGRGGLLDKLRDVGQRLVEGPGGGGGQMATGSASKAQASFTEILLALGGAVVFFGEAIELVQKLIELTAETDDEGINNALERGRRIIDSLSNTARALEDNTRIFGQVGLADVAARFALFGTFIDTIKGIFTELLPAIQTTITTLSGVEGGFGNIQTVVTNMLSPLTTFISNLLETTKSFDLERISGLANIGPLVASVGEFTKSLGSVSGMFTAGANRIDTGAVDTFLGSVEGMVSGILWSTKAFAEMDQEQIRSVHTVIDSVGELITNIGNTTRTLSNIEVGDGNALTTIGGFMTTLQGVLGLFGGGANASGVGLADPTNLEGITAFNSIAEHIVTAATSLANINQALLPVASSTTEGLRTRVAELLGTVSDTVNTINGIGSVGIETSLRALENNLGLGNAASYTISNENFNLTINMKVIIDAGRFENVFYRRAVEEVGGAAPVGVFNTSAFNMALGEQRTGIKAGTE